jgi:hypothetical protein
VEPYLDQPAGNNECGFYAMWAMLRYIGGKSPEADKLVCIIPIPFIYVNNSTKQSTDFSFHSCLWISSFFQRQRKKFKHRRLLDTEIVGLQSELASFILAEVLYKDGLFSIVQSERYKNQYGPERIARLL